MDFGKLFNDTFQEAGKQFNSAVKNVEKMVNDISKGAPNTGEGEKPKELKNKLFTGTDAMKIAYYLIFADGVFTQEEMEKFYELGPELDRHFKTTKDKIINECNEKLKSALDDEDRMDIIKDEINQIILSGNQGMNGNINGKVLLWNMLAIVYSDGEYSKDEKRIINYMVRRLNVSMDDVQSMCNTLEALMDLEEEKNWVIKSQLPYMEAKGVLDGIEHRTKVILDGLQISLMD